ncbi:histone deacetylase [Microtetraspora sp. NBRC 16547]|nr:histone deacetylase [Microtetraspora sp. NBRC 16547]
MGTTSSGADSRVGFVTHESYFWHESIVDFGPDVEPGAQLETPEPRRRLLNLLTRTGLRDAMRPLEPNHIDDVELERVHTSDYIEAFRTLSCERGGELGDFAGFGRGAFEIAKASAGGVSSAVGAVLSGEVTRAYALVRPPGHHAERHRARGYCLLANIPLAIEQARADFGVRRVAVVDWDVHHGNGTQSIYYDDADVLAISLHQDRLYPVDSGSIAETGEGRGQGATINIPLPAGSGAGAYRYAFERLVVPALTRFRPELIIVACGYDAAFLDPSSQMALTAGSFSEMTAMLMHAADDLCSGRLVFAQEGGYSPLYAPICGAYVVATLLDSQVAITDPYGIHGSTPEQELLAHQREAVDRALDAAGLRDAAVVISS